MKNIYAIIVLITMVNCNSQNKIKQNKTMKIFDIEKFKEKNKNYNSKTITLDNDTEVFQFGNQENGFVEYYTYKDNYFKDYYDTVDYILM